MEILPPPGPRHGGGGRGGRGMGRRGTDPGPRSPHRPSRPLLPPQPTRLTIRPLASLESLEGRELLLLPQRSGVLSRDFNKDSDNNSVVTQSGQPSGVPALSHLSDHSHPFQGNLRPNLSGPSLCAWEGCKLERRGLKSGQTRDTYPPLLRPRADLKGRPESSSQINTAKRNSYQRIIILRNRDVKSLIS